MHSPNSGLRLLLVFIILLGPGCAIEEATTAKGVNQPPPRKLGGKPTLSAGTDALGSISPGTVLASASEDKSCRDEEENGAEGKNATANFTILPPSSVDSVFTTILPQDVAHIDADYVDDHLMAEYPAPDSSVQPRSAQEWVGTKSEATEESDEKTGVTPPTQQQQQVIAPFDEWTREKLQAKGKVGVAVPGVAITEAEIANNKTNLTEAFMGTANHTNASNSSSSGSGEARANTGVGSKDNRSPSLVGKVELAAKRNYASRECGAKVLVANEEAENKAAVLNDKERDDYMRNPCERAKDKFIIVELCEDIKLTALEIANFELFSSGPSLMRLWGSERYPTHEWTLLGEFNAENSREIQSFSVSPHASLDRFLKLELVTHHGNEHYCTLSVLRVYGLSMADEWEASFTVQPSPPPLSVPVEPATPSVPKASQAENLNETSSDPMPAKNQTNSMEEGGSVAPSPTSQPNRVGGVLKTVIKNIIEVIPKTLLPSRGGEDNSTASRSIAFKTLLEDCRKCGLRKRKTKSTSWLCHVFTNSASAEESKNTGLMRTLKRTAKAAMSPSARQLDRVRLQRSIGGTGTQTSFLRAISWELARRQPASCPSRRKPYEPYRTGRAENEVQKKDLTTPESMGAASRQSAKSPEPVVALTTPPQTKGNDIPLPGSSMSQKEKAIMSLHRRVSALELNMSLSQEYLNELSRRYVAQSEKWVKLDNSLLKSAQETAADEAERYILPLREEVVSLRKELEAMRRETLLNCAPIFTAPAPSSKLIDSAATSRSLVIRTISADPVPEEASEEEDGYESIISGPICTGTPPMVAEPNREHHSDSIVDPSASSPFQVEKLPIALITLHLVLICVILIFLSIRGYGRKTKALERGMSKEEIEELLRRECSRAMAEVLAEAAAKLAHQQPRVGEQGFGEKVKRRRHRRPHVTLPSLVGSQAGTMRTGMPEESADSAVETATNSSSVTLTTISSHNLALEAGNNRRSATSDLSSELEVISCLPRGSDASKEYSIAEEPISPSPSTTPSESRPYVAGVVGGERAVWRIVAKAKKRFDRKKT